MMYFLLYIPLLLICIVLFLFLFILFYLMDEPSLKIFYRTYRRDFRGLFGYSKIFLFGYYNQFRNLTVVDYFNKNVEKNPEKVCLAFEDEEWTYKQVDELSNKVAHCFSREGFRRGDVIALLMENCPDFICMWLGLAKIGVVTALVNTNQKSDSLAHSLNVINMKALIFGQDFDEALKKVMPLIPKVNPSTIYCYTRKSEDERVLPFMCERLNNLLEESPGFPLDAKKFKTNISDKVLYIYTSGTTGFPKAVIVKHSRIFLTAAGGKYIIGLNEAHIFYNTLPLYHMSGGVLLTSIILVYGGKMIIRKKFSASNFWKEAVRHKVTAFIYIGEICRYLLNSPKVPEESQHSVELICGNGLRPHIWKEFQDRFRIKKIVELYGSSEGNANVVNFESKTGAIGFIARCFSKIQGMCLVKIHPETDEIMRDSEGLCIRCKPGEPGQLVAKISSINKIKAFDGYLNSADSKRKIIKDCFRKGDMAFASGDLLVMDEDGYLYFKDRCGDTFRWKGENVSTAEVENVISKILNMASCVVYGVMIPNTEGRIGMVTVQFDDVKKINFEELYQRISERLPPYSIPAFIRTSSQIESTGTYKLRKVQLQEEGYNPETINDLLYVLDGKKNTYVPLTREIYNDIMRGKMKF